MFDAYHKWLGIPKDQRPPTLYQLLSIAPDETDAEVIEEAAIRQTTHVRAYQIGPHATECTRLLNEIALARQTLLNPAKRKDYDQKLAQKAAPKPAPEQAKAPAATPIPVARPAPKRASHNGDRVVAKAAPEAEAAGPPRWALTAIVSGIALLGAVGLMTVLLVKLGSRRGEDPPVVVLTSEPPPPVETKAPAPMPEPLPPPPDVKPLPEVKPEAKPETKAEAEVKPAPETKPAPEVKPPPPEMKRPVEVKAEPPPPRLPVPEEAKVKEREKAVVDSFKTEYAGARKSTAEAAALGEKLLRLAADTKDDPVTRYALLREGLGQATQAGRPRLALQAIEDMSRQYEIDVLDARQAALANLSKVTGLAKDNAFELAQAALESIADCVAADRVPAASQFLATAEVAARKSGSKDMQTNVARHDKELKQIGREFELLQAARERLKEDPGDAKASLEAGTYLALRKSDWDQALPLLSKGKDGPLPELARKDLAGAQEAKTRRELGDDWWNAAQASAGAIKYALQNRAAHWYREALPDLTGFAQLETVKRLQQIEDQPPVLQAADTFVHMRRVDKAHAGEIKALAVSPDGKHLYSGGLDGRVLLWDTASLKPLSVQPYGFGVPVLAFDFAPPYVAVCTADIFKVWDVRKRAWLPQPVGDAVPGVFFTGPDALFRVERKGRIRRHIIPGGGANNDDEKGTMFRAVIASPSHKIALLLGDEGARCYQTVALTPRGTVGDFKATAAAIAGDDRTVALAAPDFAIHLFDVGDGGEIKALRSLPANHTAAIRAMVFTPSGQRLLTVADDRTIRLWHVPTGRELQRHLLTDVAQAVVISADARFAFTAGADLAIRQWALPREAK